jgi:hypothetical protein
VGTLTNPEEPPPLVLRFKTGELVHDAKSLEADEATREQESN